MDVPFFVASGEKRFAREILDGLLAEQQKFICENRFVEQIDE